METKYVDKIVDANNQEYLIQDSNLPIAVDGINTKLSELEAKTTDIYGDEDLQIFEDTEKSINVLSLYDYAKTNITAINGALAQILGVVDISDFIKLPDEKPNTEITSDITSEWTDGATRSVIAKRTESIRCLLRSWGGKQIFKTNYEVILPQAGQNEEFFLVYLSIPLNIDNTTLTPIGLTGFWDREGTLDPFPVLSSFKHNADDSNKQGVPLAISYVQDNKIIVETNPNQNYKCTRLFFTLEWAEASEPESTDEPESNS